MSAVGAIYRSLFNDKRACRSQASTKGRQAEYGPSNVPLGPVYSTCVTRSCRNRTTKWHVPWPDRSSSKLIGPLSVNGPCTCWSCRHCSTSPSGRVATLSGTPAQAIRSERSMPTRSCLACSGTLAQAERASRQPSALIRIILPFRKAAPEAARACPPAPYERQQERAEADKCTPEEQKELVIGRHESRAAKKTHTKAQIRTQKHAVAISVGKIMPPPAS